ncbi:4-alpha-glucanotransferase [Myxacorys almedinensis]|uniref:4-alpha-glucanotransferase n=1 Tax=Myxacorys almedinensis A TaxID=2690445 RepID=A0A8J7YZJ5_9CYAN|nr:4-alpha-glucanotransferase [Myxacorys almedinensis]NDJ17487.1 4-alpha-glucanotransferase [Myxacorys almedinensis A]
MSNIETAVPKTTFKRSSGVLLHPTSLPSQFGIGDMGRSAYQFIDFLAQSGQAWWQVLPLAPTGYEHSPYTMNFSAFAGNPLLISLEQLEKEGLLENDELKTLPDSDRINFERVVPHKTQLLELAYSRFVPDESFEQFCHEQAYWLKDFALFMALLEAHGGATWTTWEPAIARREADAIAKHEEKLHSKIQFHQFSQFKFFQQWSALRDYAHQKNISIIGDVSIYVCHNSSDVWANPQLFKLDPETLEPAFIAGVPPDYFSETGQLWGNPVYDWARSQATNFEWWIKRFRATLQYVDVVRVDHFRGFEAYWQVPAGEPTAMNGEWIKAPGVEFFETLKTQLGTLPIMAEDLGIITPEVEELRDRFEFPGMRILMFAFDGDPNNIHLPTHYVPNSIVYPGTHDNDTAIGWWTTASDQEKQNVLQYLGCDATEEILDIHWQMIRLAMESRASLAIVPLQDILGLDHRARMNDPSQNAGNWRWRYLSSDLLTPELSRQLLEMTEATHRIVA